MPSYTRLTDSSLKAWLHAGKPISGKSDGDGLTFTLSKSGRASWTLRYRHAGRQREITLGNYPDMSLKQAREVAREKRSAIDKKIDVAAEKRQLLAQARQAQTFAELAEAYIAKRGGKMAPKSLHELKRYLAKDINPRLGSRPIAEITPHDVIETVEQIGKRSDSVARTAFGNISNVFSHAIGRKAIEVNPCGGIELSAVLGDRPPPRERVNLSEDELRELLAGLPVLGPVNALVVRILLATCVRKNELIRAEVKHINFDAATWTIPAQNSKTGEGVVIPLAPAVAGWFRELIALNRGSRFVLPALIRRSGNRDRPMNDRTLNAALYRWELTHFTPHDLRSTARSHLAKLGVPLIVAERCLNHSLGGLVAKYDKHDYLDERRKALELWANLLVELETGKPQNVVSLRVVA